METKTITVIVPVITPDHLPQTLLDHRDLLLQAVEKARPYLVFNRQLTAAQDRALLDRAIGILRG